MKRIVSLILVCVLLLATAFTLTSCKYKKTLPSPEAIVNTLMAAGYEVETVLAEEGKHFDDGRVAYISATKGLDKVVAIYYNEDIDVYSKFIEAEEEAMKLQSALAEKEYVVPVKADRLYNAVWYGTEVAVSDAGLFYVNFFQRVLFLLF